MIQALSSLVEAYGLTLALAGASTLGTLFGSFLLWWLGRPSIVGLARIQGTNMRLHLANREPTDLVDVRLSVRGRTLKSAQMVGATTPPLVAKTIEGEYTVFTFMFRWLAMHTVTVDVAMEGAARSDELVVLVKTRAADLRVPLLQPSAERHDLSNTISPRSRLVPALLLASVAYLATATGLDLLLDANQAPPMDLGYWDVLVLAGVVVACAVLWAILYRRRGTQILTGSLSKPLSAHGSRHPD